MYQATCIRTDDLDLATRVVDIMAMPPSATAETLAWRLLRDIGRALSESAEPEVGVADGLTDGARLAKRMDGLPSAVAVRLCLDLAICHAQSLDAARECILAARYARARARTHVPVQAHTRAYAHTCRCMDARTHASTHAHARTPS